MAVTDRAFSSVLLYGMEYQTSQPFLQRTNTTGTVDASILGSSLSQINSLPMDSGLNSNGSYYMHHQFNAHPSHVGENYSWFVGGAAQNHSPSGIPTMSPITHTGHSGRSRKHRLQEGTDDNPLKRRRVSASSTPLVFQEPQAPGIVAGGSGQPFWSSSHSQVKETTMLPTEADQSSAMMHPIATEDMEDLAVESQSDAALRRIRDIENRLIVEDEEEEDNSRESHLPTLVMSDVLVEGFKKGLNDELTKKIVDSINRPSMELVLWKPQPEFLFNKLQSIASRYKTDKQVVRKILRTPATPLLQEINPSGADKPYTSNLDYPVNTMWNREEEEMEL